LNMEKLEKDIMLCRKTQAPFNVDSENIDIKTYACAIDALKSNQWLQHIHIYFSVLEVSGTQRIRFSHLKLEGHALMW